MNDQLMQQSCRVALAALLHDLGKFAERAGAFDGAATVCTRAIWQLSTAPRTLASAVESMG